MKGQFFSGYIETLSMIGCRKIWFTSSQGLLFSHFISIFSLFSIIRVNPYVRTRQLGLFFNSFGSYVPCESEGTLRSLPKSKNVHYKHNYFRLLCFFNLGMSKLFYRFKLSIMIPNKVRYNDKGCNSIILTKSLTSIFNMLMFDIFT